MNRYYILFNVFLVALLLYAIKVQVYPEEHKDVTSLNKKFGELKGNTQCIDYLQNVAVTPTWRFALLSSIIFTMFQLALFLIAGGSLNTPRTVFIFWLLLLLNWLFMYKSLETRLWHYLCNHGCSVNFKNLV